MSASHGHEDVARGQMSSERQHRRKRNPWRNRQGLDNLAVSGRHARVTCRYRAGIVGVKLTPNTKLRMMPNNQQPVQAYMMFWIFHSLTFIHP